MGLQSLAECGRLSKVRSKKVLYSR